MGDVVDIGAQRQAKEAGGWLGGEARCQACHHHWSAVAPAGTSLLECPACNLHQGVWAVGTLGARSTDKFQCAYCDGITFVIEQHKGATCTFCGSTTPLQDLI